MIIGLGAFDHALLNCTCIYGERVSRNFLEGPVGDSFKLNFRDVFCLNVLYAIYMYSFYFV